MLPFFPIQSINNFITYPDTKLEGINNQKLKQTSKNLLSFGPCVFGELEHEQEHEHLTCEFTIDSKSVTVDYLTLA